MVAYARVDVSDWEKSSLGEPGGDSGKDWLYQPEVADAMWLFKAATLKEVRVRVQDGGGTRTYRRGEDWAEKVCAELAAVIGLPAAKVEMAVRGGTEGCISLSVRPDRWQLHGAGAKLAEVDARYAVWSEDNKVANPIGHNLDNIVRILEDVSPPQVDRLDPSLSSFDVFAGYLLFDAWVANTDRHDQNWAILEDEDGREILSPSFDHGSALGSGMEADRHGVVDVGTWATRGFAHRFEGGQRRPLLDFAQDALNRASSAARDRWVGAIESLEPETWETVLGDVPELSGETRRFVSALLHVNQERISHGN